MKKQLLLTLMILGFICKFAPVFAQYNLPENSIWAFGNKAGVSFVGGNPVSIVTNAFNGEGCTSICSAEGQLLFYTNGNKAWDAAGNLFPHGQNLDIPEPIAWTTTQNSLIIPITGQVNKYYLFTLGSKLFVYRVDMALNGGMGDIDTTFSLTHVSLADSLTEKMITVPGCNNNVWLLTRGNFSNQFFAFNITPQGINTAPAISTAGSSTMSEYLTRCMSVSPDGNIIAVSSTQRMEILNFDKTNGTLSMNKVLDNQINYGICFSPSGKLLYGNTGVVTQYNLEDCDPAASKVVLGNSFLGDILLAPNSKVYFRSIVSYISGFNYLSSIEHPDILGAGCQFRDSITATAMPLVQPPVSASNSLGLHNTVVRARPDIKFLNRSYFDTCICKFPFSTGLNLVAASGFQNYLWSDGSTGSSVNVRRRGKHWVSYNTSCGTRVDTFNLRGSIVPVQLTYNNPLINTSGTYQTYEWYKDGMLINGASGASYQPGITGVYSVVVTNSEGCTDSAFISITTGPTSITGPAMQRVSVYPNPATDLIYIESDEPFQGTLTDLSGRVVIHIRDEKKVNISQLHSGIYFLKLMDKNGLLITVKKITKKDK